MNVLTRLKASLLVPAVRAKSWTKSALRQVARSNRAAVLEVAADGLAGERDGGSGLAVAGAVEVDEGEIERFRRELDDSSPEDFNRPPGPASRD